MVNTVDPVSAEARVAALVAAILARNGVGQTVRADEALVDVGLTSLDLVNLMLAVEAEFDILIPPTELSPQTFRTTASVARMVASVLRDDRKVA